MSFPTKEEVLKKYEDILNGEERWEKGVEHHSKSKELFREIEYIDLYMNNDSFCWKSGGDGDNGEELMYLLDMYFELKDKEAPQEDEQSK